MLRDNISQVMNLLKIDDTFVTSRGLISESIEDKVDDDIFVDKTDRLFIEKKKHQHQKPPKDLRITSVIKEEDGTLTGVEAVIDKDFASQTLAEMVDADLFIVLTGVDYVFVNYNKPDQAKLEKVTVAELEEYIQQNQFAPGSMLPKVQAAMAFVENKPESRAVITSLENLAALIESDSGTIIEKA